MDDQEKKIKPKYIDDGHTIYNMDVDGMPNKRPKNNEGLGLTRRERRAVIRAALLHFLPILFGIIVCHFSYDFTLFLAKMMKGVQNENI